MDNDVDLRNVNPHILENIIHASEHNAMHLGEDIYDVRGNKLLAEGYLLEDRMRDRLLDRKLRKPLETSIDTADVYINIAIIAEVESILAEHPAISSMFKGIDDEGAEISLVSMANLPRLLLSMAYLNEDKAFRHAVLMTMVARAIARKQGCDTTFMVKLTQAAMAHDLGEMYLNPQYLNASRRLTPSEWKATMVHPKVGSTLIAQYTEYGPEVARAIYEHHERENGSGYPRGLEGDQISKMGKVLVVSEVLAGLLLKPNAPMRRAALVLRLVPGEFCQHVLNAVHALSSEQVIEDADSTDFVTRENVEGVLNKLTDVETRLKNYEKTPINLVEKELIASTLYRLAGIRRAVMSVGLDCCANPESWASIEQDPEAMMEVDVAARELAWRVRDTARDIMLHFDENGMVAPIDLQDIVEMMARISAT